MPTLFHVLSAVAGQAKEAAKVVSDAYEKNVYLGTIALLSVLLIAAVTLLVRSWKARAEEAKGRADDIKAQGDAIDKLHKDYAEKIQGINDGHAAYNAERSKQIREEFDEMRERIYGMVDTTTKALADVSNDLRNHTEASRELVRTIQARGGTA